MREDTITMAILIAGIAIAAPTGFYLMGQESAQLASIESIAFIAGGFLMMWGLVRKRPYSAMVEGSEKR